MEEYILLQWGTLKSWRFAPDNKAAQAVIKKYEHLRWTDSAMRQVMTDEHKVCVCKLIDACTGTIQNDWSGEIMTKHQAKRYVRDYGT